MDRNALIALVLMLVVWLVWSSYFSPKKRMQPGHEAVKSAQEESATSPAPSEPMVAQPKPEAEVPPRPEVIEAVPREAEGVETIEATTVEYATDKVRFEMSNVGPTIVSWQLLEYKAVMGKPDPVEMVPELAMPSLLVWFDSEGSSQKVSSYEPKAFVVESGEPPFKFSRSMGDVVISHELLPDKDYSLAWNVRISNVSSSPVKGRVKVRMLDVVQQTAARSCGFSQGDLDQKRAVLYYKEAFKKFLLYKVSGFKAPLVFGDSVFWAGFDTNYFLTAVASPVPERTSAVLAPLAAANAKLAEALMELPARTIDPNSSYVESLVLFVGPKSAEVLAEFKDKRLDRSLNPGWLGAIADGIMWILRFFYKLTHNYGVAIILLSVVFKVVLYPLTRSSYQSMKRMQELQPMINELKKKFGKDKEKMNRELMRLYKENKVNPMGGCFPLLLQFPIFIALYRALIYSIELRHAPFAWWIKDLSAPDPYMITPILMGVAMFASQKLTGTAGADQMQKYMSVFMSIFLVFIFMSLPSGLVLYWLVYNVLTIAHQLIKNPRKTVAVKVSAASGRG